MTSRVFHFNRIAQVDPRLVQFFAWWNRQGPFAITIPQTGGIRTNELLQARLFSEGMTRARSLADTPHGRGAAVDAYPAVLDPSGVYVAAIHLDAKTEMSRMLFRTYGELAEQHGLHWGGRFEPLNEHGLGWDLPHVEVHNWRELPYPPK